MPRNIRGTLMSYIRNYFKVKKKDFGAIQNSKSGGKSSMPGIYTEKEIYGDALSAQKACTSNYNLAANECTHEDVRQTMMKILNQEHEIQQEVFEMMHAQGYYPTPAADAKKVEEAKQQYSQCVK